MINKQADKCVDINSIHMLPGLGEVAKLDLLFHIINLLLSRVVPHSSHQIRKLIKRYGSIKTTSFSCVFIFTTDHRVVEEIFHVLVSLPVSPAFNQVDKRLDSLSTESHCLVNG